MPPKKPLIPTAAISEFGDLTDQPDFSNPVGMATDLSYVPGFSDMRRRHALALAEYAKGELTRAEVPSLPVNLRWARAQSKDGRPDSEKVFRHEQKGYKLVNAAEAKGQDWFTGTPPGATVQADGSIRRGDTVLMVCDAQSARRNEAYKRAETERQLTGAASKFEDAVAEAYRQSGLPVPVGSEPKAAKMSADEPVFANVKPKK